MITPETLLHLGYACIPAALLMIVIGLRGTVVLVPVGARP